MRASYYSLDTRDASTDIALQMPRCSSQGGGSVHNNCYFHPSNWYFLQSSYFWEDPRVKSAFAETRFQGLPLPLVLARSGRPGPAAFDRGGYECTGAGRGLDVGSMDLHGYASAGAYMTLHTPPGPALSRNFPAEVAI